VSFKRLNILKKKIKLYFYSLSRDQPLENLKNPPEVIGEEQWFDCETHSPVNLKEEQKTPVQSPISSKCPAAPCRQGLNFLPLSEEEFDSDDEDLNESGIQPLSSSIEVDVSSKGMSPKCKRQKREEKQLEVEIAKEPTSPSESKYSELHYLESNGIITINRQATSSDEPEKRECKLSVSYRIAIDDPSSIQIALIIYKSNSKNQKTRRNLLVEFETEKSSSSSTSVCQTAVKDRKKHDDDQTMKIASAPAGSKFSKATKRPMISKSSLRF
jgi:hypothetical protein